LADGVASSQTVAVRVSLLPEADDARDSADTSSISLNLTAPYGDE
jgi:hypothetical protein